MWLVLLLACLLSSASALIDCGNFTLTPVVVADLYAECGADPLCSVQYGIAQGATLAQFNSLFLQVNAALGGAIVYKESVLLAQVCGQTVPAAAALQTVQVLTLNADFNSCGFGQVYSPSSGECINGHGDTVDVNANAWVIALLVAIVVLLAGILIQNLWA